jgi:hypothetical protein
MTSRATLLMWFQLRSPELADDFAHLLSHRGMLILRPVL